MLTQTGQTRAERSARSLTLICAIACAANALAQQSVAGDASTQSSATARPSDEKLEKIITEPKKTSEQVERQRASTVPYVLGLVLSDNSGRGDGTDWKPQLGFQMGRWRVGTNPDPKAWTALSTVLRGPTVGYEAVQGTKVRIALGLRLHNVTTGESFNPLETGKLTLRGRVYATYSISPNWTAAGEITQDLQNRGDGRTLTVAASRQWLLSPKDLVSVGASLKWANAEHWRTPIISSTSSTPQQIALANQFDSGWGSASTGITYRRSISNNLALLSGLSISRPTGQLTEVSGTRLSIGGQIGLLWFGQW